MQRSDSVGGVSMNQSNSCRTGPCRLLQRRQHMLNTRTCLDLTVLGGLHEPILSLPDWATQIAAMEATHAQHADMPRSDSVGGLHNPIQPSPNWATTTQAVKFEYSTRPQCNHKASIISCYMACSNTLQQMQSLSHQATPVSTFRG